MKKVKPIKNLKFTDQSYPDIVNAINDLAIADQRSPHDAACRLIRKYAPIELELLKQRSTTRSVCG